MFSHRVAASGDIPGIRMLMAAAIDELQLGFLSEAQVAASRALMGLDTQLIEDGTYFVVHAGNVMAGCGGWGRRATLHGGDHSAGRDSRLLNPATEAARIRAMYTAPAFARQGVGRLLLRLAEEAAAAAGFRRMEMGATLAGVPLYEACGYARLAFISQRVGEVEVPLVHMGKVLTHPDG